MKTTTAQILDIAMQVSRLDRKGKTHIRDLLAKELDGYTPRPVRVERKKKPATKDEGPGT
jgi:hypothetical protein